MSDLSVKWEMSFDISKCPILQIGYRNIKNDYHMYHVKIKSVHLVRDTETLRWLWSFM